MPRYDYICQSCGHIVEVMHGVNDSGPGRCERCGGEMRKLLSTPVIVFKGSGWAKKDRSSKPAGKSKPTTDSEAKPSTSANAQPAKPSTDKSGSSSDA
jgi:putative FmdB family regulatory protein